MFVRCASIVTSRAAILREGEVSSVRARNSQLYETKRAALYEEGGSLHCTSVSQMQPALLDAFTAISHKPSAIRSSSSTCAQFVHGQAMQINPTRGLSRLNLVR